MNPVKFRPERELHFPIAGEYLTGNLLVGDLESQEEKKRWARGCSLAHVHPKVANIL
jgi:hypothetical protein